MPFPSRMTANSGVVCVYHLKYFIESTLHQQNISHSEVQVVFFYLPNELLYCDPGRLSNQFLKSHLELSAYLQNIMNVHLIMEWMPVNCFDMFPQSESEVPIGRDRYCCSKLIQTCFKTQSLPMWTHLKLMGHSEHNHGPTSFKQKCYLGVV